MSDYLQRAKAFRTKKRLGQNFLINPDIVDAIIEFANLQEDDIVLEIGPGIGFVTEQLVHIVKKVIAVELDEDAIGVLEKLNADNLEIIHQDILKTDISALCGCTGKTVKVVANIPYYITSPIIAHLLGEIDDLDNQNRKSIDSVILMVQEEVARRMTAKAGAENKAYGLLSILSQFWADCTLVKLVGRRSFYPSPKVNSALVKLDIREKPLIELSDYKYFRRVVKSAFSQRRKTLKNCLLQNGFTKAAIENAFQKIGLKEDIRGEKLSIEQFGELSEELLNACKS